MKFTFSLLFALLFTAIKAQDIPFEGIVLTDNALEGEVYITIKITDGPLKGKTETFYFMTGLSSNENEPNATILINNSDLGMGISLHMSGETIKAKGIVYKTLAEMYNYQTGGVKKETVYKIKEITQTEPPVMPR
jgi:hypothetical protein